MREEKQNRKLVHQVADMGSHKVIVRIENCVIIQLENESDEGG